ncbi:2-hydroxychromene-2-carboxylate isomerase [Rhodoferax saidenbachensis]|uniref:2-hydroxychromene-2-carboxylate isomerase n=1 Tax=Rhodoferax saidenbachensis TaxID=1484693 RepID=A0A1P8K6P6_9BURK|nr:2-hydroxychromene-2-carboxylate isomerase [Rhodoferax saidenbachensis]APW41678.1 disulfide bond formation protein DsbA [Rhodoferax saidenbachensis]
MKHITFYLDFISPYAYLAFEELPQALMGLSYSVTYKPLLFAALLKHHGQLGPAEIPAKRDWTYRQVLWRAHSQGLPLDLPAVHPFNPLGLLRLAVATQAQGLPNRYVCENLMRHVWVGGADAADAERLQALTKQLAPSRDPSDVSVKAQLKAHADEAIAKNVFGVPSFEVDGKVFWGHDALPMLRRYLEGDAWFADTAWERVQTHPAGIPLHRT